MKESVTNQAILKEGRSEGRVDQLKKDLLFIGRKRLGPPEDRIVKAIEALVDVERLERLLESSLDVSSWNDLLSKL